MKKLPIGIQTFSKIREGNYYYVDKTQFLADLVENGSYYFLSRPRRFGKSLFLDTLREAFLGSKEYFKGLYLENNWNWDKKYPVIRIDFGTGQLRSASELEQRILEILMNNRNLYEIEDTEHKSLQGKFEGLIQNLHKKYSEKVVILIDEYDKPILDNITDKPLAREMRDGLRNIYSVMKGADAYIKFAFITGVSKFSKINLFSGLNNLQDITLNKRYAAV
ncbi:MAG TPA: AAA family ATPase, partial [Leptospiraceae bacterium]|nr:AAA family ATPase [Leptospiraceae bacterium]